MIMKSNIYKLRKHMAVVTSLYNPDGEDEDIEYIITLGNSMFAFVEKAYPQKRVYLIYPNADIDKEPLRYEAKIMPYDQNDGMKAYWQCETKVIPFLPEHLPVIGAYDPLEAVLFAFENDLYI